MTAAFQPNAFQNNAFQIDGGPPPGGCAFQQGQPGAQPIAFQLNAFQPCPGPPAVVRLAGGRRVILDPDPEDDEGGFVPFWLLSEP